MCIMKSSLAGRYRNKNKNSLEQMRYNQYQDLPWSFEIIQNRDWKNEETNVGILDGCFSTFSVLTSSPLDVTATNMNPLNSCLLKTGDWPDYFYKFQYLRKYKLFMLQVIIEIIHLCFGGKVRTPCCPSCVAHLQSLSAFSCGLFYILRGAIYE